MHRRAMSKRLSLLLVPVVLLGAFWVLAVASGSATGAPASAVRTSSLGQFSPTFVGPAATGCSSGCSLLSGPFTTSSTASSASLSRAGASARAARASSTPRALPAPDLRRNSSASRFAVAASDPALPSVSCPGAGCDSISTSSGGAIGVKGLNAVDSAEHSTLVPPPGFPKDVEPPDQGLCAGNGYVVETNNIGEILVFNTALQRQSAPISDDTIMGLAGRGWSSGGDPSCEFDPSNGGHWFFTEIVSASSEQSGGPFTGCFSGTVARSCYEGIAVTQGSSPFGPYHVYFLNGNYNPSEPGYPFLLNDFAKISVTRDAFLLFYDEFPLGSAPGLGGGLFNGAQEFAFSKSALERGLPVTDSNGQPDPFLNVAIENMGLIPTPDGTCAGTAGVDCWAAAIPAQPAGGDEYDNGFDGSGFMMDSLDFNSFAGVAPSGDDRIAVWDWTGLAQLSSPNCASCNGIHFGGQLFSGVESYNDPSSATLPSGYLGVQKAGPIPLGDECGPAGLSTGSPPPTSCPEGGIASNGDFMTQVSQAQRQLWGAIPTEINQTYGPRSASEVHLGAAYWVVDTSSFDRTGRFVLTNQGYVSAPHEDMEFPAMAGEGPGGNGGAIMVVTLNGDGGPTHAEHAGFYPSTAYGRLTATSNGLLGSTINIADLGQAPQDGFTEYQGYPGVTGPRWGDYSWAIYPGSGDRIYFANNYIQYPSCTGKAFTLTIPTCGGTRDGYANWGTSVNYVVP
jgi:hypothetical protein